MGGAAFLLIVVSFAVLLWWYIRNLQAEGQGTSGILGLKEEEEISGEELRVRRLARKERGGSREVEAVRRRALAQAKADGDLQDPGKEDKQAVTSSEEERPAEDTRPYRRIER